MMPDADGRPWAWEGSDGEEAVRAALDADREASRNGFAPPDYGGDGNHVGDRSRNGRDGSNGKPPPKKKRATKKGPATGAVFTNYRAEKIKDENVKIGLSAPQLGRRLSELTGGWPKRVVDRLFVPGDDDKPLWLGAADTLFAWVGRQLPSTDGNGLRWAKGEDKVSQAQFHAHLCQTVERFDALESMPHHPPLPGAYYLHPAVQGGDGKALRALLARFRPATEADAALLKALLLTLVWGGPPGQRPAFLIESEEGDVRGGRGVGKSTTAMLVGRLAGGHVDARPNEEIDKLMTRLLSPAALDRRVALLDNIKALRFSWSDLEAMITTDTLSGRQLYVGEGRRPNTLVWLITLNSASLSKDMAQRCVPLRLKRPDYDASWQATVEGQIDRCRWQIVGDLLAELRRPAAPLARFSRWSAWEQAVLARVPDPAGCQRVIEERQAAIDDDAGEASIVRDGFRAELRRCGHEPDAAAVWISATQAANVLNAATGEKYAKNRAGVYLATLHLPELRKSDRNGTRGWAWRGSKSPPDANLTTLGPDPDTVRDPWSG
jgi:hypothetical protein